ncbi:hypothetical protein QUF56_15115 [Ureibacillus composti]|nr:hypothetical protein [Ureibacillus composti]
MEGIIMMVVVFIISSLLSGKKKKEPKGMPPFSNQQNKRDFSAPPRKSEAPQKHKSKSLEDFANEVFQQLSNKDHSTKKALPKIEEVKEAQIKTPPIKNSTTNRPSLDMNRTQSKVLSTARENNTQSDFIQSGEIGSFIPTNKKALVQAIIASEIIGPPKAKR